MRVAAAGALAQRAPGARAALLDGVRAKVAAGAHLRIPTVDVSGSAFARAQSTIAARGVPDDDAADSPAAAPQGAAPSAESAWPAAIEPLARAQLINALTASAVALHAARSGV